MFLSYNLFSRAIYTFFSILLQKILARKVRTPLPQWNDKDFLAKLWAMRGVGTYSLDEKFLIAQFYRLNFTGAAKKTNNADTNRDPKPVNTGVNINRSTFI